MEEKTSKNKIIKILFSLEAGIFLSMSLLIALLIGSILSKEKSLITYLPNNIIALEYFSFPETEEKIQNLFFHETNLHFNINEADTLPPMRQACVLFSKYQDRFLPLIIVEASFANGNSEIKSWAKKNNLLAEDWKEKFIVLALNPEALKILNSKDRFKYRKALNNFRTLNNFSTVFYFDSQNIANELLGKIDRAMIIHAQENADQVFAGIKEENKNYKITIAFPDRRPIASLTVAEEMSGLTGWPTDKEQNEILLAMKTVFSSDNNLPIGDEELNKILNGQEVNLVIELNNSTDKIISRNDESWQNKLLLYGAKAPHYYIVILKNNPKTKQILEIVKNYAKNYLDEKFPEEQIKELPDGTYMTEFWSNPQRFSFTTVQKESSKEPIFFLANEKLNFELAYRETADYVFISNAKEALSHFDLGNKKNIPANEEPVYVNNAYFKDKSELFQILNTLGKYTFGFFNRQ